MKKVVFLLVLLLSFSLIISKETTPKGKLIVKVININNNKGNIRAQLYNNPSAFPTHTDKAIRKTVSDIENNTSTIIFDNLSYGEYAVTVHHDEDLDGYMNKNFLGYPTEGWGISRNPKVLFKLPSFDEAKIFVNKKVTKIVIKINN